MHQVDRGAGATAACRDKVYKVCRNAGADRSTHKRMHDMALTSQVSCNNHQHALTTYLKQRKKTITHITHIHKEKETVPDLPKGSVLSGTAWQGNGMGAGCYA